MAWALGEAPSIAKPAALWPGVGLREFFPNAFAIGCDDEQLRIAATSATVRPAQHRPEVQDLRDVWLIPGFHGLFNARGNRIPGTEHHYIPPAARGRPSKYAIFNDAACPQRIDLPVAEDVEEGLYLGASGRHYGHFLTDGTSRLWAHLETPPEAVRIMRAVHVGPVAQMLDALGIEAGEPARPLRFRRMLLPEPMLQLDGSVYHGFDAAHLEVTRQAKPVASPPVYLSRTRMEGGTKAAEGEMAMEELFAALGFEIVHPQLLSLREQIGIFNSAPVIAGLMGSAFHTAIFSTRNYAGKLILFCSEDEAINWRFLIIGALKSFRSYYVRGCTRCLGEDGRYISRPDIPAVNAALDQILGVT